MNYPRMPKKRPDLKRRRKPREEVDKQFDKVLEDTLPTGDPVAINMPVPPEDDPVKKKPGQHLETVD